MKDKYLYLILGLLVIGSVIFTYRNFKEVPNEVVTRNVLPVNEDKELKEPDEVRKYVLEMARREKLNVAMVDKIGYCESRWRYDAVSRTGKYQGIFQISSIHNLGDECRNDVVCATKWSLSKMKKDGYWAWSCSTM